MREVFIRLSSTEIVLKIVLINGEISLVLFCAIVSAYVSNVGVKAIFIGIPAKLLNVHLKVPVDREGLKSNAIELVHAECKILLSISHGQRIVILVDVSGYRALVDSVEPIDQYTIALAGLEKC